MYYIFLSDNKYIVNIIQNTKSSKPARVLQPNKMGWVTPIYKAGYKSECNKFRPITILCTLSKLLERHVHDSFYKFLQNNHFLYLAQSECCALHSCETTLTKIIDKWTSNMEKGLLNGVVLLDLRKAFDLVDNDVLLHKLSLYQCDDITI